MSYNYSANPRLPHERGRVGLWIEWAFATAILILLVRVVWFFTLNDQLPPPYFYGPSDTFMDWFNSTFWGNNPGAYRTYKTVYPPLTFVVQGIFSKASCYTAAYSTYSGWLIRDCDWIGRAFIYFMFLINIPLIALTYRKVDRRTWIPRSLALSLGLPMTYAFERGNVIMLCLSCVVLAWGPLLRSTRLRWLFAGLAVNFKIYLISAIAAQLLRRRWLWFEGALIATIAVYLITWGYLGEGSPAEIARNIVEYSKNFIDQNPTERVWFPSTTQPLIALLGGQILPAVSMFGSRLVESSIPVLQWATRIGQVMIVGGAVSAWLRPEVLPRHRVAALAVALALMSSEAGGYSQVILFFFVMMERWEGFARPFAIVLSYMLCLPGDIIWTHLPPHTEFSYLADHEITVHIDIGIGIFIRPLAVVLIGTALAATTIWSVWKAHRQEAVVPVLG